MPAGSQRRANEWQRERRSVARTDQCMWQWVDSKTGKMKRCTGPAHLITPVCRLAVCGNHKQGVSYERLS